MFDSQEVRDSIRVHQSNYWTFSVISKTKLPENTSIGIDKDGVPVITTVSSAPELKNITVNVTFKDR